MFSYKIKTSKSIVFLSTLTYTIYNKNLPNFPSYTKFFFKELITIDIEIKDRNRPRKFFLRLHNKLEDILFSTIQRIPEKYIPCWLMNWLEKYLDKRISELKHQSIKMTWHNMCLQNAVDDMRKSK